MIDVMKWFNGKKVLVTGGTGMIGDQVIDILRNTTDAKITSVSLEDDRPHPGVKYVRGDLTDPELCDEVTQGKDVVLHVAGIKGSIVVTKTRPADFFVPLVLMNTNVLESARYYDVERVVYTSSIGAYPSAEVFVENLMEDYSQPPMDFLPGWAKRVAELQIKAYKIQYGLNYSVVRPCNVYGPRDNFDPETAMVIPSLMAKVYSHLYEDGPPVEVWGDGSAIRDFLYCRDAAWGILRAAYYGTGDWPYVNLGSGKGYSIKELVMCLHDVVGFEYTFNTEKPSGFPRRIMDIDLARDLIGFEPSVSLSAGLMTTWEWYKENHDRIQKRAYFK